MLMYREIARCFHGRMEFGEFVFTNPNPTESTELYSRDREMNYQTLRNCVRKASMSGASSRTKEKSSKKKQKTSWQK